MPVIFLLTDFAGEAQVPEEMRQDQPKSARKALTIINFNQPELEES